MTALPRHKPEEHGDRDVVTILVVEDSPEDRVLYKRILKRDNANFRVLEAESAAQGLEIGQNNEVDCVLLDYHLPDADGMDFIKSFQQQAMNPQAAIIMVTGQGNEKTAVEAMKLGALDYITKNSISEAYFGQSILNAVERSRLRQQISRYQRDLEKSNRSLSEFAHIVSHDLKAPLRRIVSYCDLLREEAKSKLEGDAAGYVDRLSANALRLQRFINDLLEFSRVMHAQEESKEVDLNKLVQEILEDLDPLIEESGAKIEVAPLPVVKAYPLRLRQLFMNLINNAIKYRSKEAPLIKVGCEERAGDYLFWVRDNGLGIPKEYQANIFQAFQRLHTHDAIEGTGLGLSICKQVVAMHKGQIGVESETGKGSKFWFTISKDLAAAKSGQ
ncbi:MAG TPA: ATP-binding protein [Patescibacteria group bacterium]|nr:ATP-binding protein [Patescibacteria group bacterium]